MTIAEAIAVIQSALAILEESAEELRDLDAAIGDGDLGITVQSGSKAVSLALGNLDGSTSLSTLLRTSGAEFASANPSTFSALIAAGLLASAKELEGVAVFGRKEALVILETLTKTIMARGKAVLGDKTIVDVLYPTITILENEALLGSEILDSMIVSVGNSIEESAAWVSKKGRAAWVGERTIGRRDGGQTAYLRFLEALNLVLVKTSN
jgi:dihydroxyacetone kinase-like protein